jgi:hypothetical protein
MRKASAVRIVLQSSFKIRWDIEKNAPALFQLLAKKHRWLPAAIRGTRARFPVASTCSSFEYGEFLRPVGHFRAFYKLGHDNGALAFKGTEIFAKDLNSFLQRERDQHVPLGRSSLEAFPLVEQKIPWAVLVQEALGEAHSAADFQTAHIEGYGTFARAPIPLLVVEWDHEILSQFSTTLLPKLSVRAAQTVTNLLRGGLASYVYHYPNPPLRVSHVDASLPSVNAIGYLERAAALSERTDCAVVVARWISLVVRALALGYLPCTLSHEEIGQAVDPKNSVIDGGFVDLDSFQRIESVSTERELFETLILMMTALSDSVETLLVGDRVAESRFAQTLVGHFLHGEIRRLILEEMKTGASFDPRIVTFFDGEYVSLGRIFGALLPPTSRDEGGFG